VSSKSLVEFKGTKDGIIVQFSPDIEMDKLLVSLKKKLTEGSHFFKGAKIISLTGRDLEDEEVEAIITLVRTDFDLDIVDRPYKKALKIDIDEESLSDEKSEDLLKTMTVKSNTVFHRGTLRSGKRIESEADLVVLGDVNPGAELVANGNIVVMGYLRGVAHAGRNGDPKSFVSANKLQPTQLRIGALITRAPDEGHDDPDYPEIAFIRNNNIIIEPIL